MKNLTRVKAKAWTTQQKAQWWREQITSGTKTKKQLETWLKQHPNLLEVGVRFVFFTNQESFKWDSWRTKGETHMREYRR